MTAVPTAAQVDQELAASYFGEAAALGEGTVYPSFRVTGEWGSIEAEQVLMSQDGNTLMVPLPAATEGATLTGDGWTVTMSSGWIVVPGPRDGDLQLVNEAHR